MKEFYHDILVSDCAIYEAARKKFRDEFERPFFGKLRKTIADRIREIDRRENIFAEPVTDAYLLDSGASECTEERVESIVNLVFELPYGCPADTEGQEYHKRMWKFLAVEHGGDDYLYLEDEDSLSIRILDQDLLWLYNRLSLMGFFDPENTYIFERWHRKK